MAAEELSSIIHVIFFFFFWCARPSLYERANAYVLMRVSFLQVTEFLL